MQRVVFITGASRGIGAATVKKFADNGWRVAGFYNKTQITSDKSTNYYQMDVQDYNSIAVAFKKASEELGRVDCLVHCVGVYGYKTLEQYDIPSIEEMIATNEMAMYLVAKEALQYLKNGSMVFIGSTAAQVGSFDPVYAGSKGAVYGFVKSMAKALAPDIRVNCVSPGVTDTDMTRAMNQERLQQLKDMILLKKIATPSDIANGIYFLASDEAGHITGASLDVNGGYVLR